MTFTPEQVEQGLNGEIFKTDCSSETLADYEKPLAELICLVLISSMVMPIDKVLFKFFMVAFRAGYNLRCQQSAVSELEGMIR